MLKKFTEQLKQELSEAFGKNAKFVEDIKEVEDRSFEVIASTEGQDRDGEVIMQDGIDTANYLKNPVILFGHDYWSLPIGKATGIEKRDGKTIIRGVFASEEANPMAERVFRLYKEGIITAVSIGFIPKRYEGNRIVECELLELSFVPVPANPEALSIMNWAKELIGMAKEVKMTSELAFAVKSAINAGVKVAEPYAEVKEGTEEGEEVKDDTKTPTEDEKALEAKIEAISVELKEMRGEVSEGLKLLSDEVKGLGKIFSEKAVELLNGSVKGEGQSDETKSSIAEILADVKQKTQLIDTIAGQVNQRLKGIK